MTAEIKSLGAARAEKENDNKLVSPADMLRDAASDIDTGEAKATSAMALVLDIGEDGKIYDVAFYASNLRCSDMLALLEVTKQRVLALMGN